MSVHNTIADSVKGFGGHLECETCGRVQELGNTSRYFAHGWPKCCELTMRWFTQKELDERSTEDACEVL